MIMFPTPPTAPRMRVSARQHPHLMGSPTTRPLPTSRQRRRFSRTEDLGADELGIRVAPSTRVLRTVDGRGRRERGGVRAPPPRVLKVRRRRDPRCDRKVGVPWGTAHDFVGGRRGVHSGRGVVGRIIVFESTRRIRRGRGLPIQLLRRRRAVIRRQTGGMLVRRAGWGNVMGHRVGRPHRVRRARSGSSDRCPHISHLPTTRLMTPNIRLIIVIHKGRPTVIRRRQSSFAV